MLTTPPLAPKVIAALAECGIRSLADLQAADPCRAFLLLKDSGLSVTRSVFWQLVALYCLKTPQDLSEAERTHWQQRLADYPPVTRFPPQAEMEYFMRAALQQAQQAAILGEIPVGAIVVRHGQILATAHNRCVSDHNISHHAEIQALAQAGQVLGNYRLDDCDLYVTLEPCAMCASAIVQARIRRLVFAAAEPKTGAAGSVLNLFTDKKLNPHTSVASGILAAESTTLLRAFFRQRR